MKINIHTITGYKIEEERYKVNDVLVDVDKIIDGACTIIHNTQDTQGLVSYYFSTNIVGSSKKARLIIYKDKEK
jgi:hypothetical protein